MSAVSAAEVRDHGAPAERLRFEGDVNDDRVPAQYQLGPAFVPKGRYLDVDFLRLELEKMFSRTWQIACRVEELPGIGNYVEYQIGDRSILLVRESSESIRAYHNACRHRGTRLAAGRGRVGAIICPFHGWRWNLDGTIRLVLDDEEFAPRTPDDLGLQPVRCETWGGFAFVNMDLDAQPLLDYLDPIPTIFAPFQLENMRYKFLKAVPLPCNWKTAMDGFLEAYHLPGTHPQFFRIDKANKNPITVNELDQRVWSPSTVYERHANYASVGPKKGRRQKDPASSRTAGPIDARAAVALGIEYLYADMKALETERSVRAAQQLRTADVPEGTTAGQHFMQLYRNLSLAEGYDWPVITPEQWAAAGTAWNVFPNSILLPNQGSVIWYRARPNGLDPDSCLFELGCIEQIPVADYGKPCDYTPEYFADYHDADLGLIWEQDLDNSENVTIGMHSPSFDGHRLSTQQEMAIYNHHRVADRYLWDD